MKALLSISFISIYIFAFFGGSEGVQAVTLFIGTPILIIALLLIYAIPNSLEYRRTIHAVQPQRLYEMCIEHYFNDFWHNDKYIELPTPYFQGFENNAHFHPYRNNQDVWNQSGWWQNQWRAYLQGKPSIYTGDVDLPAPYMKAQRPSRYGGLCVAFYRDWNALEYINR